MSLNLNQNLNEKLVNLGFELFCSLSQKSPNLSKKSKKGHLEVC